MPVVDVQNTKGKKVTTVDLAESIFNVPVKPSVLHEVVTMQLANRRAATAAVKHRGEVKGSTRKLFRQKGTGRARRSVTPAASRRWVMGIPVYAGTAIPAVMPGTTWK